MKTVLVVAAHPDDEVLGVGATIAKMVEQGYTAYALIMAEGQTSRWSERELADEKFVDKLHEDTAEATRHIGYEQVFFANYPDNRMDAIDLLDVIKKVESYVNMLQPEIIFTHHGGDLNIDHRITAQAVCTATRPIGNKIVKSVYQFETVSATEWNFVEKKDAFMPNVFVDVSGTLQKKLDAMKCYRTELCDFPHPRSLEMLKAQAIRYGSIVGKQYAEAFELMREVKEF